MSNFAYYKISNPVQYTTFSLIMAVDNRGAIGFKNDLPWRGILSNKTDMEWFREHTKSKVIVMGYNTWVSIGRKPLPGRINVIVSKAHGKEVRNDIDSHMTSWKNDPKNHGKRLPSTFLVDSPESAISIIKGTAGDFHHGGEVMVIGGAQIYQAFMEHTSRIYLTTFDYEFEADTFVHLDLKDFDLVYRDKTKYLEPKFEIWDVTAKAAERPDSEIMQISHEHKPAEGIAAEIAKEKENVQPSE